MLEADAEKRNSNRDHRLSPSPSPHRKLSPDLIASATINGMTLQKELPPTPIEEEYEEEHHDGAYDHHHDHHNHQQQQQDDLDPDEEEEEEEEYHVDDEPVPGNEDEVTVDEHQEPTPPPSTTDNTTNNTTTTTTTATTVQNPAITELSSPGRSTTSHSDDSRVTSTARFTEDTPEPVKSSNGSPYGGGGGGSTSLQRRASVFSLSRVSFSAQLSRLTSLSLPLSSDISSRIRALPSAGEACNALINAGDQIGRWIDTAKKVLRGLDAEDDVEWAAQGRESLNGVDAAVGKFSGLVHVYVELIEELRQRPDISSVKPTLSEILKVMEVVLDGWKEVKGILKGVKDQVETAMEWTELWTMILQDIQAELDACQTIVFEEEEKRHRSLMEDGGAGGVDLDTLQTIMEETPGTALLPKVTKLEDSSLLGLIARMQPLRVSLDFLPMRLQSFQARAEEIFPSACEDLNSRQSTLEKKWKKLNSDVEGLKKELGEDKWIALFRNAGKQTASMIESVERSLNKLRDAVNVWEESGGRIDKDLAQRMQNYEAKRVHYGVYILLKGLRLGKLLMSFEQTGSAIDRALGLISKGVRDRITVNGEIIRLETAMRTRWKNLEASMADMEQDINDLQLNSQTLRDSFSTITSLDVRSYNGSGMVTPGSSPASSVIMATSPIASERQRSPAGGSRRPSASKSPQGRNGSISGIPKKSPHTRLLSTGGSSLLPTSTGMSRTSSAPSYQTPPQGQTTQRKLSAGSMSSAKKFDGRPRWNTSTNTEGAFKPLSLNTSSPYTKASGNSRSAGGNPPRSNSQNGTRIPVPSPLSQSTPGSPNYHRLTQSIAFMGRRASAGLHKSPTPAPRIVAPQQNGTGNSNRPELRRQTSTSQLRYQSRRPSQDSTNSPLSPRFPDEQQDEDHNQENRERRSFSRPASALASSAIGYIRGARMSMLPRPSTPSGTGPTGGGDGIGAHGSAGLVSGRQSVTGSVDGKKRYSMPPVSKGWGYDGRPKWKH